MRVDDVMTRTVVTVSPSATVEQAAKLMVERRVSGLPVVDEAGGLVGIVSEGDLIVRQGPVERLTWWQMFFDDGEALAREYRKRIGTIVSDDELRCRLNLEPWMTDRGLVISAAGGIVELWGVVDSDAQRAAIEATARSIEGCRGVKSNLVVTAAFVQHYGV